MRMQLKWEWEVRMGKEWEWEARMGKEWEWEVGKGKGINASVPVLVLSVSDQYQSRIAGRFLSSIITSSIKNGGGEVVGYARLDQYIGCDGIQQRSPLVKR